MWRSNGKWPSFAVRVESRSRGAQLTWFLLLAGAACSSSKQHPAIRTCDIESPSCTDTGGIVIGPTSDAGSDASDADAGTVVAVEGRVFQYDDEFFSRSSLYTLPAVVEAEAPAGERVRADYTPSASVFELVDVLAASSNWLSVAPAAKNEDAFTTFHPVNTHLASSVDLALVRRSALDLIYGQLAVPVAPDVERGHVVLFFKDNKSLHQPVAGIRVSTGAAEVVAYASGAAWTDVDLLTTELGLVVVGNIAAAAFPGTGVTLHVEGAVSGSFSVRVAADAVSVVDVEVAL